MTRRIAAACRIESISLERLADRRGLATIKRCLRVLRATIVLTAACFIFPVAASAVAAPPTRPNVLFIAVDDLRPMLGCYGDPSVQSPHIDRLAASGVRFERAYCQFALCNPSRSSLLAGRRPETLGVFTLAKFLRDGNPDVITLPEHFRSHGYETRSYGKIFHVTNGNHDDERSWSVPPWPPRKAARPAGPEPAAPVDETSDHSNDDPSAAPDVADDELADGRTAAKAIEALEDLQDKPFFLAVGFHKPHLPFIAPQRYWDRYDPAGFSLPPNTTLPENAPACASNDSAELRRYKGIPKQGAPVTEAESLRLIHGYHACVSYTDAQVGRLLDAVERLGLAESTVVVLWGDHGYHLADQGTWTKRTAWEIATRVPLVIRAPGRAAGHDRVDAVVELLDIYPTLVDLCGLEPPPKLEGRSLVPLLADAAAEWPNLARSLIVKQMPEAGGRVEGRAVRTPRYRWIEWSGRALAEPAQELYDHDVDPLETRNIAGSGEGVRVIGELRERLANDAAAVLLLPTAARRKIMANGLAPEAAAPAMSVPPGFSVKLLAAEPDVCQPIAMCFDDRGRLWVAEAYSYPRRVDANDARDRILIFEDTDGDHAFDSRKVFKEGLNLVSGLEVGFGGVWVGAAPELLFIPDADGDDVPDAEPRVLLDGWGWQDTHETLNAFTWGPDGWLYGCHGVFTHSAVAAPGTPDDERTKLNAGIWRYHPTRHRFEVFAEGTSNPWGIDLNQFGHAFETACVIPHLYHVIQGGRYQRQAGQHFNPWTFDDIKTVARHRHWVGGQWTPEDRDRSDAIGGGHAHAGACFYLGGAWPEKHRGKLFMNNIHGARLNEDRVTSQGSGYVGDGEPDFLFANDAWSQFISLQVGPDGQMVILDWYDRNQCHHGDDAGTRRLLETRLAAAATVEKRLRVIWALHAIGPLDERVIAGLLDDPEPLVRSWAIQLAAEVEPVPEALLGRFASLAATDPAPVVRLALCSAAQRLSLAGRDYQTTTVLTTDGRSIAGIVWSARRPRASRFRPRRNG